MSTKISHRIQTERLLLRLPQMRDAPDIQRYAGAWEVAVNTLNIPHPYEDGMAQQFIERVEARDENSNQYTFAIIRQSDQQFLGMVGLGITPRHEHAEIGYWIGVPFWGNGYATEAARALVDWGFNNFTLNRIHASYFTHNPASRRVMEKSGMTFEGIRRQYYLREIPSRDYREYVDVGSCSILHSEWQSGRETS